MVSPTSARMIGPTLPSHTGCSFFTVKVSSVYSKYND